MISVNEQTATRQNSGSGHKHQSIQLAVPLSVPWHISWNGPYPYTDATGFFMRSQTNLAAASQMLEEKQHDWYGLYTTQGPIHHLTIHRTPNSNTPYNNTSHNLALHNI